VSDTTIIQRAARIAARKRAERQRDERREAELLAQQELENWVSAEVARATGRPFVNSVVEVSPDGRTPAEIAASRVAKLEAGLAFLRKCRAEGEPFDPAVCRANAEKWADSVEALVEQGGVERRLLRRSRRAWRDIRKMTEGRT
jgi:hypothetical protein